MVNKKERIKSIILSNEDNFKRFELIEQFIDLVSEADDIIFLLNILISDRSSVVRHEAAAQLLKVEQKKPSIIAPLRERVIKALLHVVARDPSMVAKHESAEALSYIGDISVVQKLNEIASTVDKDDEILETIDIAKQTIVFRNKNKIAASELGNKILESFIEN